MTKYLIDIEAGTFRPSWTDNEAVGFLIGYLDAVDRATPAEVQMAAGYRRSAGCDPYPQDPKDWLIDKTGLRSLKHPEDPPYAEVSRCKAGDGSDVIMFDCAMTAVVRGADIVWLARLD